MVKKLGTITIKKVQKFLFFRLLILFFVSFSSLVAAQPLYLRGDDATWNQKTYDLWVKGHVSVVQHLDDGTQRRLNCDALHYNRLTDKITAYGAVELTEPNGDVLTADHLELDSHFNTGFRLVLWQGKCMKSGYDASFLAVYCRQYTVDIL